MADPRRGRAQRARRHGSGDLRAAQVSAAGRQGEPDLLGGWDTKFGAHALRPALQGWQIASTGTLTLPMPPAERAAVLAVKKGRAGRDEVSGLVTELAGRTSALLASGQCRLPVSAPNDVIDRWSVAAHERHWFGAERMMLADRGGASRTAS